MPVEDSEGSVNRFWEVIGKLSAGVIAILFILWLTIIYGLWKSDARKYAEATCNPYTFVSDRYEQCLVRKFGPGTAMKKFGRYVQGTDFLWWALKSEKGTQYSKFIWIRDNEKGPDRISIIVKSRNNVISEINVKQGYSVEGWD